jgi:hypothetical protein
MSMSEFNLLRTAIHLDATQALGIQRLGGDEVCGGIGSQAEFDAGRIVSIFEHADDWTYWERHPIGDELAVLLGGSAGLVLSDERREWVVLLAPARGTIIPAGVWHRAVVREPSSFLFVTPTPSRTEHREWPE